MYATLCQYYYYVCHMLIPLLYNNNYIRVGVEGQLCTLEAVESNAVKKLSVINFVTEFVTFWSIE